MKHARNGGVYETSGAFTRVNNTVVAGTNFQWSANNGGFSANGGKLTVTIGNDATTEQVWGTALANNGIRGTLKFGSTTANAETDFQNNIDLGDGARTVDVAAGAGGDFATISGVIRNSTGTGSLTKTGAGTLTLSGTNTYTGTTLVSGEKYDLFTYTGTCTLGTGITRFQGDLDGDFDVDWADLQELMDQFGTRSVGDAPAVPEPGSVMLLVFGAAALLRRRQGYGGQVRRRRARA